MRRRKVLILPEAQADLAGLYDQIAEAASEDIAFGYVESIKSTARNSISQGNVDIAATTSGQPFALLDFAAALLWRSSSTKMPC